MAGQVPDQDGAERSQGYISPHPARSEAPTVFRRTPEPRVKQSDDNCNSTTRPTDADASVPQTLHLDLRQPPPTDISTPLTSRDPSPARKRTTATTFSDSPSQPAGAPARPSPAPGRILTDIRPNCRRAHRSF
jgi:hypothetical protein